MNKVPSVIFIFKAILLGFFLFQLSCAQSYKIDTEESLINPLAAVSVAGLQLTCVKENSFTLQYSGNLSGQFFCQDNSYTPTAQKTGLVCPGGVEVEQVHVDSRLIPCDNFSQLTFCGVKGEVQTNEDSSINVTFKNLPFGCMGQIAVFAKKDKDDGSDIDLQGPAKFILSHLIEVPLCEYCATTKTNTCEVCPDPIGHWQTAEFGACLCTNSQPVQTREVKCVDSVSNEPIAEEYCHDAKPALTKLCQDTSLNCRTASACEGNHQHGESWSEVISSVTSDVACPNSNPVTSTKTCSALKTCNDGVIQSQPSICKVETQSCSDVFFSCTSASSIRGQIYKLPVDTAKLPNFASMNPRGEICINEFNIPNTYFDKGFPGVEGVGFEWFALHFSARIKIDVAGTYKFSIASDDGSKLYIDNQLVVNNDGIHALVVKSGSIYLTAGYHNLIMDYYQGPAIYIALQLYWIKPNGGGTKEIVPRSVFSPLQ